jgi:hypothetical protein
MIVMMQRFYVRSKAHLPFGKKQLLTPHDTSIGSWKNEIGDLWEPLQASDAPHRYRMFFLIRLSDCCVIPR